MKNLWETYFVNKFKFKINEEKYTRLHVTYLPRSESFPHINPSPAYPVLQTHIPFSFTAFTWHSKYVRKNLITHK